MEKQLKTYREVLSTVHGQIKSIKTCVRQVDMERQMAVVECTITTWKGEEYSGIGDAKHEDLSPEFADAFVRVAETRAKARAVSDLANIGEPLSEEMPTPHEVFTPTHKKIVANSKREQASSKSGSEIAANLIKETIGKIEDAPNTKREAPEEIDLSQPPIESIAQTLLELTMEARDEQIPIMVEKYGYSEEELRACLVVEKTGLYTLEGLKIKKLPEIKHICFKEFGMDFLKDVFKRMKVAPLSEAVIAVQDDELREYLIVKNVSNEKIDEILATYVPPAFIQEEREKESIEEVEEAEGK